MISLSLPRSRNTCGWSNGGLAPTHMNSCEPISITATPASLWKWGTTLSAICVLRRQEGDVGKLVIRPRLGGGCRDLCQQALGQRLLEARGRNAPPLAHGDDAVIAHHPEGSLPVDQIACQFHRLWPLSEAYPRIDSRE